MLNRSEQPDAAASECGAIGGSPHSPAVRANMALDRDHWSFDPAAYRLAHIRQCFAPAQFGMAAMVALCAVCFVLLLATVPR